jgi:NAD-dependent SIR2 family protein deacetylase
MSSSTTTVNTSTTNTTAITNADVTAVLSELQQCRANIQQRVRHAFAKHSADMASAMAALFEQDGVPVKADSKAVASSAATTQGLFVSYDQRSQTLKLSGRLKPNHYSMVNVAIAEVARVLRSDSKPFWKHVSRRRLHFVPMIESDADEPEYEYSLRDSELIEYEDETEIMLRKALFIAEDVERTRQLDSGAFVVYTGAGISCSCSIPCFRGPRGVWTAKDRNLPAPECPPMEETIPSFTHRALVAFQNTDIMAYLVSQNVDGLHRRSGIFADRISELHGNCYLEICASCHREFVRDFDASHLRGPHFRGKRDVLSQSGISHITGRRCNAPCNGMLRDSIIHFGEDLPERDLERGFEHSRNATSALVIGSSLRVTPASDLPAEAARNGAVLNIINLQSTGGDKYAVRSGGVTAHSKCDEIMYMIMAALGFDPVQDLPPALPDLSALVTNAHHTQTPDAKMAAAGASQPFVEDDADMVAAESKDAAQPELFSHLPVSNMQLPSHLLVVQTHSVHANDEQVHQWSLSLQAPDSYPVPLADFVHKVVYYLHETFDPPAVTVKKAPFVFSATGWGVFQVKVKIVLKDGYAPAPIETTHMLSFDQDLTLTRVKVPPMRLPGVIANSILGDGSLRNRLRPTSTRVRRTDGSTFVEQHY